MAFPSTFLDIQNDVILRARLLASLDLQSVKDWINKTYYDVVVQTEALPAIATMTLTSGSASYTLPAAVARIRQMAVKPAGGSTFNPPLTLTTLDEILQRRQEGGDSTSYGPWSTHYTMLGLNDLELWPTPSAADVITIYYSAFPTALVNNTDVPILDEPYGSNLLIYGACAQAGDFKGDPSTADWQNSYDLWMQRYVDHLNLKRGEIPGQFHQWGDGWDQPYSGALTGGY